MNRRQVYVAPEYRALKGMNTQKTTLNFKASENDPNKIIPCTEHQAKVIYMINNSPLMFGASIVAIALIRFIDGVISIFDLIKEWEEMTFFCLLLLKMSTYLMEDSSFMMYKT